MAKRIIQQLVDDVDGTVLDEGDGETISFGLDGRSYEIDVSPENATNLRSVIGEWSQHARRVKESNHSGRRGARSSARPRRTDLDAVRVWARENGHKVSDRGRVPLSILAEYDSAH